MKFKQWTCLSLPIAPNQALLTHKIQVQLKLPMLIFPITQQKNHSIHNIQITHIPKPNKENPLLNIQNPDQIRNLTS